MDWLDSMSNEDSQMTREQRILDTTLLREDTVLELNMFPYRTPEGISHRTLWCVHDMSETEITAFVEQWIAANMPHATQWNYDLNESRSIDLFHVHVYIDIAPLGCNLRVEETAGDKDLGSPAKRRKQGAQLSSLNLENSLYPSRASPLPHNPQ